MERWIWMPSFFSFQTPVLRWGFRMWSLLRPHTRARVRASHFLQRKSSRLPRRHSAVLSWWLDCRPFLLLLVHVFPLCTTCRVIPACCTYSTRSPLCSCPLFQPDDTIRGMSIAQLYPSERSFCYFEGMSMLEFGHIYNVYFSAFGVWK